MKSSSSSLICCVCVVYIHGIHAANGDVTREDISVTLVTKHSQFKQRDLPDVVMINVTVTGRNFTRQVTLYKRPETFHRAPGYVFGKDGQKRPERPYATADDGPAGQDLTWYTTRFSTNPQMAVCLIRRRYPRGSVHLQLKDDGFMVLDDTAYSLKTFPSVKRRSPTSQKFTWSDRYVMVDRNYRLTSARQQHRSKARRSASKCTDVYIDMCVHVDFDLYEKLTWDIQPARKSSTVHMYVRDLMNEVQAIYEKLPPGDDLPFNIHIELEQIILEKTIFDDPIQFRNTTQTQAVINDKVYENVFKAHDLITSWLKNHNDQLCDHYTVLTGTFAATFKPVGDIIKVYRSNLLGVAWDKALCYKHKKCSLVFHSGKRDSIIVAHELGHSMGMQHDQVFQRCANATNTVMGTSISVTASAAGIHWSSCSIASFASTLQSWITNRPACVLLSTSQLASQCSQKFGSSFTQREDAVYPSLSNICGHLQCMDKNGDKRGDTTNAQAGTFCGQGKKCDSGGKCIPSSSKCRAPRQK